MLNFLGFLRKIQISIDDSLCLNIICSHFVSIKSWKIRVFSKFAKNPVTLPYKYLYLILLITKKPGHISGWLLGNTFSILKCTN